MEIRAIERQIADDRARTLWGQVFVIAILSGIMLAMLVAASLAMLLLPEAAAARAVRR